MIAIQRDGVERHACWFGRCVTWVAVVFLVCGCTYYSGVERLAFGWSGEDLHPLVELLVRELPDCEVAVVDADGRDVRVRAEDTIVDLLLCAEMDGRAHKVLVSSAWPQYPRLEQVREAVQLQDRIVDLLVGLMRAEGNLHVIVTAPSYLYMSDSVMQDLQK